jgi:hypothetical protein
MTIEKFSMTNFQFRLSALVAARRAAPLQDSPAHPVLKAMGRIPPHTLCDPKWRIALCFLQKQGLMKP